MVECASVLLITTEVQDHSNAIEKFLRTLGLDILFQWWLKPLNVLSSLIKHR
jgi:hypothetical protein